MTSYTMSNTTLVKTRPPILQEEMEKRRIMKHSTTVGGPKFQTRFFMLYKDKLEYKTKNKKDVRGSISVLSIKTCEDMCDDSFNREHVFQVGYLEKGKMFHLYISAKNDERREVWKTQIRKLCSTYNDHRMQTRYHPGHFKRSGSGYWSCCKCADKQDVGCEKAFSYDSLPTQGGSDLNRLNVPKTPLLRNTLDSRTFVRMPSDCYDDSDELDEYFSSPSPTNDILQDPVARRKLLSKKRYSLQPAPSPPTTRHEIEHKTYRAERSETSLFDGILSPRYQRRRSTQTYSSGSGSGSGSAYFGYTENTYMVIRKSPRRDDSPEADPERTPCCSPDSSKLDPLSEMDPLSEGAQLGTSSTMRTPTYHKYKPQSSLDGGVSTPHTMLSQSTPNYCPLTQKLERGRLDSRLYSISSMTAQAGSERYDSVGGHSSRLDSQGSTIGSSFCESIPRTESDYQRRVEEGDQAIYTSSSIGEENTTTFTSSTAPEDTYTMSTDHDSDSDHGGVVGRKAKTIERFRDLRRNSETGAERAYSGVYVNTHGHGFT